MDQKLVTALAAPVAGVASALLTVSLQAGGRRRTIRRELSEDLELLSKLRNRGFVEEAGRLEERVEELLDEYVPAQRTLGLNELRPWDRALFVGSSVLILLAIMASGAWARRYWQQEQGAFWYLAVLGAIVTVTASAMLGLVRRGANKRARAETRQRRRAGSEGARGDHGSPTTEPRSSRSAP